MKSSKILCDILAKKYHGQTCASFYLIDVKKEQTSNDFIDEFKTHLTKAIDHPDLLTLELKKDEPSYKVDSPLIPEFFQFLSTRPLELRSKIIFLKQAEKINDTVANKLLKTLEEVPDRCVIFFFTSAPHQILPTILSRAIKLSIKEEDDTKEDLVPHELVTIELIKKTKDRNQELELTQEFLTLKCENVLSANDFKKCDHMLSALKHFEQSSEFNNSLSSRLSLFV